MFRTARQVKAAYRLLDRQEVTHAAVCVGHSQHVRRDCTAPGLYLQIEDSSTLSFPGRSAGVGLGPIGEDFTQDLWMRSTRAVRVEASDDGVLHPRLVSYSR